MIPKPCGDVKGLGRIISALGVSVLSGDANYLLLSGVPTLYERLLSAGVLLFSAAVHVRVHAFEHVKERIRFLADPCRPCSCAR